MKTCNNCSIEKSSEYFPKNKRLPDGLGYECKECAHKRYRGWAENNSSYCKDRNRQNYSKIKDKVLPMKRAERLENIEKFRERDSRNAKRNVAAIRAKTGRRRAARELATPAWLTEDHLGMMKITYAMAVELGRVFNRKFHVDHIHPLRGGNVCGLHVPWNLQVLPMEENIAKHNRLIA